MSGASPNQSVRQVARWLADAGARAVTVITGAGISTDSGIPDYRGPQGIWTRDPSAQRRSDISEYVRDPLLRQQAWRVRVDHPAWAARPNAGHRALVDLERSGRLRALITQNIDGLHQAAGQGVDHVIEIHGTVHEVECLSCPWRGPTEQTLARVRAGEADPPCPRCGGILKTATISFGQALHPPVLDAAVRAARECTLFLAIGSSLTVYPAALLPMMALEKGARLVVVNAQPTPYDELADACLTSPIGSVLPLLVRGLAPS
jgi:NAD-dependent deacetylase